MMEQSNTLWRVEYNISGTVTCVAPKNIFSGNTISEVLTNVEKELEYWHLSNTECRAKFIGINKVGYLFDD